MTHRHMDIDPPPRPTMTSPNPGEAAVTTTDRPPPPPPPSDADAPPDRESNRPMLITVIVLAVAVTAGLITAVALTLNRDTPQFPNTTAAPTPQQNPPSPSAQETPTATATPTNPPLTPEEQAVADAESAYRRYLELTSQILATLPYNDDYAAYERAYTQVATGVAQTQAAVEAGDAAKAGQRLSGEITLASYEVVSLSLGSEEGAVSQVVIEACDDFSRTDVLGPGGHSTKNSEGPQRYVNTVTLRFYEEINGWRVAETASDGTPC